IEDRRSMAGSLPSILDPLFSILYSRSSILDPLFSGSCFQLGDTLPEFFRNGNLLSLLVVVRDDGPVPLSSHGFQALANQTILHGHAVLANFGDARSDPDFVW